MIKNNNERLQNIHSHKLLVVCIYITDNVEEFVTKLISNNHFIY